MAEEQKKYRNRFIAALVGTGIVALCCFTPVLVVLLAAVGLSAFTPYLDFVLFPALAVFIVLTVIAYRKWRKACRK
jgi:mercuric ion transport protein